MIQSNFNILLYGVGSKINFLNYFCMKTFSNRKNILLFNGFNPNCNMRIVMQALKTWAEKMIPPRLKETVQYGSSLIPNNLSLAEKVAIIKQHLTTIHKEKTVDPLAKYGTPEYDPLAMFDPKPEEDLDVYLVIHCMDSSQLRSEES